MRRILVCVLLATLFCTMSILPVVADEQEGHVPVVSSGSETVALIFVAVNLVVLLTLVGIHRFRKKHH